MFKPKRLLDPAEIVIPPREDDSRYAAELDKLRALQQRWDQTEVREKRARLHWRAQQPAIVRTRGVDAAPKGGIIERALQMITGDGYVPGIDLEAELIACNSERRLLHPAILAQQAIVKEIEAEQDYELSRQFARLDLDAMKQADAAIAALFESLEIRRGIIARMLAAGRQPSVGIVFTPDIPPSAVQLGDPARPGTQAAAFRQALQERER